MVRDSPSETAVAAASWKPADESFAGVRVDLAMDGHLSRKDVDEGRRVERSDGRRESER